MEKSHENEREKYLSFLLGDETYALEILTVQEIIGIMHVTPVPKTPVFIKGVINLRGKIIPIIDLKTKFGLDVTTRTERSCIIILRIKNGQNFYQFGILVDHVTEVNDISKNQMEPPPSFGSGIHLRFLKAIAKMEQQIVLILDAEKVLSNEELEAIEEIPKKDQI